MPGTHLPSYRFINLLQQRFVEALSRLHQQKQHHAFVRIGRPPLAHKNTILNHARKVRVNDTVDLCAPKPDSTGIQHTICAAEEDYVFGHLGAT